MARAFRLTFQAGGWILRTPFALVIILFGLLFDHIIRMLITLGSQYYRLIELPEASFGLIGSAMATLGLFIPRLAMQLARRHSPAFNMGLMAGLTLIGLIGMTLFLPVAGLIPVMVLMSVMYFMGFFVSHYLNRITDSHQRATVLSFKGLSFNLAYGLIGLLYSLLLYTLRYRASRNRRPHPCRQPSEPDLHCIHLLVPRLFHRHTGAVAVVRAPEVEEQPRTPDGGQDDV